VPNPDIAFRAAEVKVRVKVRVKVEVESGCVRALEVPSLIAPLPSSHHV
jgi:hypothetical protein